MDSSAGLCRRADDAHTDHAGFACESHSHDVDPGGRAVSAGVLERESVAAALAPLWVSRYVFRVRPRATLALPAFGRGAILRGAFGHAFRRLVCHDLTLVCRACPLAAACPYPQVFESAPPRGSQRLRNYLDLPRPFVFDPPDDPRSTFGPADTLTFGLTVAGRANAHLSYFVMAFRNLADAGLGPRRAPFELEAVDACAADGRTPVYLATRTALRADAPRLRAADLLRPGDLARTSLVLRLLTPLELKDDARRVERAHFGPLVRRLRDRAAALAAFFGDAPLELDFRGLAEQADSVRLVADRTRRVEVRRTSTRTGARHDVGGLLGEARYEGAAIGALMPLVRLGELIHVGRHAAFGNGRIEVTE